MCTGLWLRHAQSSIRDKSFGPLAINDSAQPIQLKESREIETVVPQARNPQGLNNRYAEQARRSCVTWIYFSTLNPPQKPLPRGGAFPPHGRCVRMSNGAFPPPQGHLCDLNSTEQQIKDKSEYFLKKVAYGPRGPFLGSRTY